MGLPPRTETADQDAAPDPGSDHEQRGTDVEGRVSHQRRVEGVEYGARARQNRRRGHQRADDRDPESRPRPGGAGDPAERGVGDQVTERHDEERREDQGQQHAVRGDREVIQTRRAEKQLHASARERLHHGHHRAHGEGGHCDPEVGEHQPRRGRQRAASTMIDPCIRWWASPQYSLQTTRYSPGVSNVGGLAHVARRHRQVDVRADDLEPVKDVRAGDAKSDGRPAGTRMTVGRKTYSSARIDTLTRPSGAVKCQATKLPGDAECRGVDRLDVTRWMHRPRERGGDDGSGEEHQHAGCGPHPVALVALDVHCSALCLMPWPVAWPRACSAE